MTATDSMLRGRDLTLSSDLDYFSSSSVLALDIDAGLGKPLEVRSDSFQDFGFRVPVAVSQDLRRVSQLGLKEAWLGRLPGSHDRWQHSLGVNEVAFIWLSALEERVPKHCLKGPLDTWRKAKAAIGTATLLHDAGHLPFAHLLDEALKSINWLPEGAAASEGEVLSWRFRHRPEVQELWRSLLADFFGSGDLLRSADDVAELIEALIVGRFGTPWMQVIVNSPIDADKIDYLRYDTLFLKDVEHPVRTRIQEIRPAQWMTEFLSEQEVNHAGLLALHGRSARAAADLWRERMFLYDRFYVSPELRLPERMALEIVQQFLIRSTMSDYFMAQNLGELGDVPSTFLENLRKGDAMEPAGLKFKTVVETMEALKSDSSTDALEFRILERMKSSLVEHRSIDQEVREFFARCFACLDGLRKGERTLRHLVASSLVREPLVFGRENVDKVRTILRPIQHTYSREALIDIVALPRVLAAAQRYSTGRPATDEAGVDYQILVPAGPASTWGPGKRAVQPLSDEAVLQLERPYARVVVIAPDEGKSARACYVWDRVRSVLLDADVDLGVIPGD